MIAFVAERLLNRSGGTAGDLSKITFETFSKFELDTDKDLWVVDELTGKNRLTEKGQINMAKARQVLRSKMIYMGYEIDQDVKNGLYGSETMTKEERLEAALDYYTNVEGELYIGSTDVDETRIPRDSMSQAERDKDDLVTSGNLWLQDMKGANGVARQENAAGFIVRDMVAGAQVRELRNLGNGKFEVVLNKVYFEKALEEFPNIAGLDPDSQAFKDAMKAFQDRYLKKLSGFPIDSWKLLENGEVSFELDTQNAADEELLGYHNTAWKERGKVNYGAVSLNKQQGTPNLNGTFGGGNTNQPSSQGSAPVLNNPPK